MEHTPDTTGIFDAHHPPADERISDCVHCGFCPHLPHLHAVGRGDGLPRGRIYLMKLGKEGSVPLDDTYVQHFDACLGCMACVTACPSGVKYDELIEAVRPQLERNYRRSLADRLFREMIFQLFRTRPGCAPPPSGCALPTRGRSYLLERRGLRKRLPARLRAVEELMPPARLRGLTRRLPAFIPAQGTVRRRRVAMLEGCVQRVFFRDVNEATARVLAAEGCDVIVPRAAVLRRTQRARRPGTGGTGAGPSADRRFRRRRRGRHRGERGRLRLHDEGAGRLLRDDPIRRTGGGVLGEGARHLRGARRPEPVAPRHPIEARVAYHDARHLGHGQRVRLQPRAVLRTIPAWR